MVEQGKARISCGTAIVLFALSLPTTAIAGNVGDVLSDLYGGDGITLDPNFARFHTAHFGLASQSALNDLSNTISAGAGIFGFNSTVSGFTFDVQAGIPVRSTESLGPLIAERAETLGEGRLNFAMAFSRTVFKKFDGDDLDDLSLTFVHDDCCTPDGGVSPSFFRPAMPDGFLGPGPGGVTGTEFELNTIVTAIDLELEQNIFALFGTYGVTNNFDVGVVVPLVYARAEADSRARLEGDPVEDTIHRFDVTGSQSDAPDDRIKRDAFGLGDIIARAKFNASDLVRPEGVPYFPDVGVLGQVSFATGDEKDLLGLGETTFLGLLIASVQIDWFSPHVNIGYEVATGNSDELDNLRYVVGFDASITEQLTAAAAVLGRYHPDGSGDRDLVDLAVGARWDVLEIQAPFTANILIPLNKNTGLRPDFTWSVGWEITF